MWEVKAKEVPVVVGVVVVVSWESDFNRSQEQHQNPLFRTIQC